MDKSIWTGRSLSTKLVPDTALAMQMPRATASAVCHCVHQHLSDVPREKRLRSTKCLYLPSATVSVRDACLTAVCLLEYGEKNQLNVQ